MIIFMHLQSMNHYNYGYFTNFVSSTFFIKQILHLQNDLTYMKVSYTDDNGTKTNITLSDICYKPLAPQNTNCTIMSILNYFQNSLDNLNRKAGDFDEIDYHDQIHYCTRYSVRHCTCGCMVVWCTVVFRTML